MWKKLLEKRRPKNSAAIAKTIDLIVPQMGEGLCEVVITRFLKQPGDWVNEDEVLYEMETDKSTVEIESPQSGKLQEWLATEGSTLAVGAILGRLEITSDIQPVSSPHVPVTDHVDKLIPTPADAPNTLAEASHNKLAAIPPRTRSYCKTKGISSEEMLKIPATQQKLMPADVDIYLKAKLNTEPKRESVQNNKPLTGYHELALSSQQQLLIQRFKRSQQQIIPATIVSILPMNTLNQAARTLIAKYFVDEKPIFISEFQIFAYIVAQVCSQRPKFRSVLISEQRVREYAHVNLGIAVETETGDLVTAVVGAADTLSFPMFIDTLQEQIQLAVQGIDQAKQAPHVLLSYMGQNGVISGSPLLVEPAVATLFLGTPYYNEGQAQANLSLTFDHRLMNGIEAAYFLQAVANTLQALMASAPIQAIPAGNKHEATKAGSAESFQHWFLAKVSTLIDKPVADIDLQESLGIQGMDSMKAVALTQSLEDYFKESLPVTLIWHHPSCTAMLDYLTERFALQQENSNKKEHETLDELVENLKNLSTTQLKQLFD